MLVPKATAASPASPMSLLAQATSDTLLMALRLAPGQVRTEALTPCPHVVLDQRFKDCHFPQPHPSTSSQHLAPWVPRSHLGRKSERSPCLSRCLHRQCQGGGPGMWSQPTTPAMPVLSVQSWIREENTLFGFPEPHWGRASCGHHKPPWPVGLLAVWSGGRAPGTKQTREKVGSRLKNWN